MPQPQDPWDTTLAPVAKIAIRTGRERLMENIERNRVLRVVRSVVANSGKLPLDIGPLVAYVYPPGSLPQYSITEPLLSLKLLQELLVQKRGFHGNQPLRFYPARPDIPQETDLFRRPFLGWLWMETSAILDTVERELDILEDLDEKVQQGDVTLQVEMQNRFQSLDSKNLVDMDAYLEHYKIIMWWISGKPMDSHFTYENLYEIQQFLQAYHDMVLVLQKIRTDHFISHITRLVFNIISDGRSILTPVHVEDFGERPRIKREWEWIKIILAQNQLETTFINV